MKTFTSQEVYEYLCYEWQKLNISTTASEEMLKSRKKSFDQKWGNNSDPKINKQILNILSEIESKLIERTHTSQRYIACLSVIMSVIGIEGSESAKNIKEGVNEFYGEKKQLYKDIVKNEKDLLDLITSIYKEVLGT